MMDPLVVRIGDYIRKQKMIREGDHVLAAVSGGADSVFLLCVLDILKKSMSFSLQAVHVEHGIRGDSSKQDAVFTEKLCARKGVPCRIVSVDAPAYAQKVRMGLEEAARDLRYQIFGETAELTGCQRVAVAHHMEDNAETMLFHLARGTGLAGLAGIPPVRGQIIRPLLCVSRNEIEKWLENRGETWCMDLTNLDDSFSRNRVRTAIIPQMEMINPSASRHMAETADLLRRTADFLDRETDRVLSGCMNQEKDGGIWLQTELLKKEDPVLQEHVFYRVLQQAAGSARDLTRDHVRSVIELCGKENGKRVDLPDGLLAEKEYGRIRLWKEGPASPDHKTGETVIRQELKVPGETEYQKGCVISAKVMPFQGDMEKIPRKPYTKWFDYDKIEHSLLIRQRETGDYLQVNKEGGHKSIQDLMVEEKIPARQREQIPLIADGKHIVWVIGGRISEAYKVTRQTKNVLMLHITEDEA